MCSRYDDPSAYDEDRGDVHLAVEAILDAEERRRFLDTLNRLNPGWRGATVADYLATLAEADARLDVIEPLHAERGVEVPERGLLKAAAYVAIYAYGATGPEIAWPFAFDVVDRVRRAAPAERSTE